MAIKQARNNQELENMLMPALEKAIDYVVQKIWNDNRELIRTIVYESYQPEEYERTGEFKEAWDTDVKRLGNFVRGEMKYDPRELTVNYNKWQHGSRYVSNDELHETVMTTYLAEVIYQGLSGDLFGEGPWTKKRDVWAALNKEVGIRKIKQYFEEGMRRNGLNFKGHTASIKVTKYDEK